MFAKFKSRLKSKRAFACVDKNDVQGLIACLDEGFEVNTTRAARIDDTSGKAYTMGFEETVGSRAFRDDKWDILKVLIERYGAGHLMMSDWLNTNPPQKMVNSIMRKSSSFPWGDPRDLKQCTFETSPLHYCLWQLTRPSAKIVCLPSHMLEDYIGPFNPSGKEELNAFLQNCGDLEQRNTIDVSIHDVKNSKTHRAPRAL